MDNKISKILQKINSINILEHPDCYQNTNKELIGQGRVGKLFKLKINRQNKEIDAVIKYIKNHEDEKIDCLIHSKNILYCHKNINEIIITKLAAEIKENTYNFRRLYDYGICPRKTFLLMEYCQFTLPEFIMSVYKKFDANQANRLVDNIMIQIFASLYLLQKHFHLMHMDLKANNILIKIDPTVPDKYLHYKIGETNIRISNLKIFSKIIDFGDAYLSKGKTIKKYRETIIDPNKIRNESKYIRYRSLFVTNGFYDPSSDLFHLIRSLGQIQEIHNNPVINNYYKLLENKLGYPIKRQDYDEFMVDGISPEELLLSIKQNSLAN